MTATGVLWVVSSDFQKKVAEYDTSEAGATGQPRDVEWCGNDAIIVNWDALVLVVGPYGETLKSVSQVSTIRSSLTPPRHYYISPTYLVPELDGIRIFSAEHCDFLHRVPASLEKVFRPGSTSPAAILYDAADHFDRRSPKADENIRSIKPDLASAVDVCVEAAGQEWEAAWQRKLLNVSQFYWSPEPD
jgi:vacuolar protein sorting-associated protein 16